MSDVASLIQALYSDDIRTRRNATFDLVGGGGAVIEPLLPLLSADDADVRYAAALVLDQLKHLVTARLFSDAEAAVQHLAQARARLRQRSVEDDKFVLSTLRGLLARVDTETARDVLAQG